MQIILCYVEIVYLSKKKLAKMAVVFFLFYITEVTNGINVTSQINNSTIVNTISSSQPISSKILSNKSSMIY